ncbi:helix-turn-helix domain-containing protein [Polymorphobacter sp. PAMC 29334]|uniref:helix-turn-helix domain-containing protein n=1 Tax=Polymorphobacter sp. PAMC 29334 TaxID=2862331 RepID=UPI001C678B0E|nr:helix-turn-helix transcriptional regulator [Polymorphobacter sp. PAMC 29334]QYE35696.1 helix-turn-helix domain-containing protein [Polymorphobacter sp. PAMC 29334]
MTEDPDLSVQMGTSNVFADLGHADSDTHLLKAQLVARMADVMADRKLTQVAAAKASGVSQPDVSRILKGQFRDVSVERLMRMLTRLGCEVDIVVRLGGQEARPSTIHFS